MSAYITITGNLGDDAVEKYTQSGTKVVEFSIANNYKRGEEKVTNWYRCSAFGKVGDECAAKMKKGGRWKVEGQLRVGEKDGKSFLNMVVDRFPEPMFVLQQDDETPF